MSLPSDILLPANAKYFGIVDYNNSFNSEYDITWSFTYALTGNEHGVSTFLTNQPEISGFPGHYLGYTGTIPTSAYILSSNDSYLLDDDGDRIISGGGGSDYNGCLVIAFDSSGYFGLSSIYRDGVALPNIKKDVIAIRDGNNSLVVYEQLSNISNDFSFYDTGEFNFQTIRFRYANSGRKLTIDYKNPESTKFNILTSISTNLKTNNYGTLNAGFCFCSPISSSSTNISTLKFKNFHVQGVDKEPDVEYNTFTPLTGTRYNTYTTISTISA